MKDNTLKLYQSAGSPNSRRVRIFLAEKGLEIPFIPVDLGKGEQHSDAYRAIGNAYRAANGFMILQRTNTALAVAAHETAPVRADCSASHRVPLFHIGGFS